MFSLPIPQILVSLHNDNQQSSTSPTTTSSPTNFGSRIASTLQKMGNNISVAADELSEELSALLEATSIASASTRDELYSFFDDGFDDDAEEIPGTSGTRTPAIPTAVENVPQGYFALATSSKFDEDATTAAVQIRKRGAWSRQDDSRDLMMLDEGYYSSESGDVEMDDDLLGDEEEREALLPAKRFSWRGTSPERCSLLYWEK